MAKLLLLGIVLLLSVAISWSAPALQPALEPAEDFQKLYDFEAPGNDVTSNDNDLSKDGERSSFAQEIANVAKNLGLDNDPDLPKLLSAANKMKPGTLTKLKSKAARKMAAKLATGLKKTLGDFKEMLRKTKTIDNADALRKVLKSTMKHIRVMSITLRFLGEKKYALIPSQSYGFPGAEISEDYGPAPMADR